MKNKIFLSVIASLSAILPTFANSTQITMTAIADDFLVVQLERASDSKVVSGDDYQKNSNDPAAYEILGFGNIDARGVSAGNLTSANSTLPGTGLSRVILDSSRKVYSVTNPPSTVAGALYYLKGGYQIRTVRSPGNSGEMTTDVDVYSNGDMDIDTFVDLSATNALTAGTTVNAGSLRAANSGVAAKTVLKGGVVNNTPFLIDLGVYVKNTTSTGAHTTTLTFTGT